jgi:hypothetical protein
MWAALEPLSTTIEAGGESSVSLRIRNTGEVVDEYHVDAVGDPALWCTIEPTTIRLYPGTTGSVQLVFKPPRGPEAAAGPHAYGVRVMPTEHPDAVTVIEGNLTVAPFTEVRAELLPPTVRGWWHAKPRLAVDNFGNTRATAAVLASAQGNQIGFDIRTPSLQIEPRRAHFGTLGIRPERRLWLGQKVSHPYTVTVQLSGGKPVTVSGTYLQSALLPRWLGRLAMLLGTLAVAALALWFTVAPGVAVTATGELPPATPASSPGSAMSVPVSSAEPTGTVSAAAAPPPPGAGTQTTSAAESGSDAMQAPPAPTPAPFYDMTISPKCTTGGSGTGTSNVAYFEQVPNPGPGWKTNISDATGSGCQATFDAMPTSGQTSVNGPNRGLWLFDLPSATNAACTVTVDVPNPPSSSPDYVAGDPAQYTVDEGTVSTSKDITSPVSGPGASFQLDQTSSRGSAISKGVNVTEQYIAVRLNDYGLSNTSAMYGVGAVEFRCTHD